MPKVRAIGLGAGGHASCVLDALHEDPRVEVIGLLDPKPLRADRLGVPVLGDDQLLTSLEVEAFFIGVGSVGDPSVRRRLAARALEQGLSPLRVVHPRACVSEHAWVAPGAQVLAGAIVQPGARVAGFAIVNSGAIVEHDCFVGEFAHVASGARLGGEAHVGAGAHIGLGATVRERIRIGEGALVGAGAVAVANVPAEAIVVGVPARPLERP